jgi:uncharacterized protein YdaU (DUF1376 family)
LNYYEHHLGDYLRDTAHLSMVEDGAYRRLMDAYYIKEHPLPLAMREVCRLVRAVSKPERDAVAVVLGEFFDEVADGWRHKRCDTEIARYLDKQAKAKRSAEARWGASKTQCDGNANASLEPMRTHSEGNAPQSPVTKHQTPEKSGESASRQPPAKRATPTPAIARPDDIDPQTWADWCQLRKAKRATVSVTVIDGARGEAEKAGMSLEEFLQVWCRRGSQGLEADWLKPDERMRASPQGGKHAGAAQAIWGKQNETNLGVIDV